MYLILRFSNEEYGQYIVYRRLRRRRCRAILLHSFFILAKPISEKPWI